MARVSGKGDPVEQSPRESLPAARLGAKARGIGRRTPCDTPAASRSPLKGLNAAKAGLLDRCTVAESAASQSDRVYTVPEDELSREIFSEIAVHEQEIQALRNEMMILKQRRGKLRQAWAREDMEDDGTASREDEEEERKSHAQSRSQSERVSLGEPTNAVAVSEGDEEILILKRNIEILRETDRQRQIEVEQQAARWRMEADESIRIAEEMR